MARIKYFWREFFWTAVLIQLAMFTTATNVTTIPPSQVAIPEDTNFGYAWGPWGPWTPCSRTCGGGVSVQERQCLPRSKPVAESTLAPPVITVRVTRQVQECPGVARRYHECNTAPCPGGSTDKRAEQCAAYDRRPFRGRFYTWVPYIDGDRPCLLNCRPLGQHFYASLARVADGTPCTKPGFRAICVQGECKVVGRESVLAGGGSSPELHCGRRLVSGLFSRPRLPIGYSYVTTIPLGACRLNISAILPSENYIALKISNGSYIINGEFAVSPPGVYEAAGARFHYTRADRIDSIFSVGPVYFPIDIMILSSQPNPTIRYEYFTESLPGEVEKETARPSLIIPELQSPSSNNKPFRRMHHDYYDVYRRTTNVSPKHPETSRHSETPRNPELPKFPEKFSNSRNSETDDDDSIQENVIGGRRFIWKIIHFTQCSHTCGGGIQVGKYRCVELRANFEKEVSPAHCMGDPPSNKKRKCGTNPCPPRWRAALWSACPECGPASRTRIVGCVQDHSKGISKVSDNKCPQPKPRTSEPCNIPECTENKGVMFVTSKRGIRPKGAGLTETFRDGPVFSIAANHTNFDMGPEYSLSSPAVGWLTTNWTECVGWCVGGGVRSRNVQCTDPSGCAPRRPPEDHEKCQPQQICEAHDGEWFAGDWSPCTSQCEGKQVRGVICIGGTGRRLRDAACKAPRPDSIRDCGDGCKPSWFSSEWSPCEENCTIFTGVQRRTVWCATRDGATQDSLCVGMKPASEQPCKPKCEHAYSQPKPRAPQPPTAFKIPEENEYLPKEIREATHDDRVIEHVRHYETTTEKNIRHHSHNENAYDNVNNYDSNPNANNFNHNSNSANNHFDSPNNFNSHNNHYSSHNSRTNNNAYDVNTNGNSGYRPNIKENGPKISVNNANGENSRNGPCTDKLNNCGLAVQARLCNYNYYKQMCCLSCGSSNNLSY